MYRTTLDASNPITYFKLKIVVNCKFCLFLYIDSQAPFMKILGLISCVLILWQSCAFPTHSTFHSGRTLPAGQVGINFGYNALTNGWVAPSEANPDKYPDIAQFSNRLWQYKYKLPKEMIGAEGGIRVGIINRLEYQFHGSLMSTLRNSIRYQFLGGPNDKFAGSIGVGYLYNRINGGTMRIRDIYCPITVSFHPVSKIDLYYSLILIDRKYRNMHKIGEEIVGDYRYSYFQSFTSGGFIPLNHLGLQIKVDDNIRFSLEYGFAYTTYLESKQASLGLTYLMNHVSKKK